jgi:hypothetical protein
LSKAEKLGMLKASISFLVMADQKPLETKEKKPEAPELTLESKEAPVDPEGVLETGWVAEELHEGKRWGIFGLDKALPKEILPDSVEEWTIPDNHAGQVRKRHNLPMEMKLQGWIEKASAVVAEVPTPEVKAERGPVKFPEVEPTPVNSTAVPAMVSPEEKDVVPDNISNIVEVEGQEGVPIEQALNLIKGQIGGKGSGTAHEVAELAGKHHKAHKKAA